MNTIISPWAEPYLNLALEEYIIRSGKLQIPLLLLYRNSESVIIGKNQNPFKETDLYFLKSEGIPYFRRLSGGGTVYHDTGNVNFAIFEPRKNELVNNYKIALKPIINALIQIGAGVYFDDRNSLRIEGKKISGNAQFQSKDILLTHGTLLVKTDLLRLEKAISPNFFSIVSKSTESVRSETGNLSDLIDQPITADECIFTLAEIINEKKKNILLKPEDMNEIYDLSERKYKSFEWNFGRTPEFELRFGEKNACSVLMKIREGMVVDVYIDQNGTLQNYHEINLPLNIYSVEQKLFTEKIGQQGTYIESVLSPAILY